jgi:hypothetical protein
LAALYVRDADHRFAFIGQIAASTRHSVRQARQPPRTEARERVDGRWRWLWTTGRSAAFLLGVPAGGSVEFSADMCSLLTTTILSAIAGVLAWVALNFAGAPVLALRKARQEALGIADRRWAISPSASDEARSVAIKALNDAAAALVELRRADAIAVRRYCDWLGYDLELAAGCLRGLAKGVRGGYSDEKRKRTRDALFVSLGAARGLSATEIATATEAIAIRRRESGQV